ncbi:peptidase M48 [Novimethylophilus kurashikiensis]|uniref:Peptidase M48 n=1 Tax=Novimethylophilus kurashikiensis TaxID=1825523 RepID=A0A2R5FA40_9PROT|nr:tetratricopeptide repeat protein [Novimethylophilus kurashikiensis]GBG14689.1 peptidase M48 [Novimethylophilus kurashikiensis]
MSEKSLQGVDIGATALEAAVDKILSSPVFAKSPRQQDLLRYLVTETINGNAARLKGYSIAVEVFGRSADFDPAEDAIVRVEMGRLRSKLREYYQTDGAGDDIVLDVPKGHYAVTSWSRASNVAESIQALSAHPRIREAESKPSLAVLPLINLSPDVCPDYFVDGITDTLIFELSRLSGLIVISRQSSFTYRSTQLPSAAIGEALGVRYLIEGSVQCCDGRVRTTIKLVEASSGIHLWSERFERGKDNLFELQDALALSIAKALQVKLVGSEAALFGNEETNNIEAYDELLHGLECHWKYSPSAVAEARAHFQHAADLDPTYAAAHAWLARALLFQWVMRWDADPALRDQAFEHARLAVSLNRKSPYVLAIMGWAHLWCKHREEAIATCREAVALDPNNFEALLFLSMSLSSAGFGEEALYYIEKARRLNPHSSPFYEFVLGQAYYVLEDYDKAIAAFQRGTELNQTFPPNYVYLSTTYALLGMDELAAKYRKLYYAIMGGDKTRMIVPPWTHAKLEADYRHLLQLAGFDPRYCEVSGTSAP